MMMLVGVTAIAILATAGVTSIPGVEQNRPLLLAVGLVAAAVVVAAAVWAVRMERAALRDQRTQSG